MSAGNLQYEMLRAFGMNKKTMVVTGSIRTGRDEDYFQIDNPVIVDDPAADVTITVPNGIVAGQELYIIDKSNSGTKTLTVSVTTHLTTSPETFTISTEGQNLQLMWDGEKWITAGGNATVP